MNHWYFLIFVLCFFKNTAMMSYVPNATWLSTDTGTSSGSGQGMSPLRGRITDLTFKGAYSCKFHTGKEIVTFSLDCDASLACNISFGSWKIYNKTMIPLPDLSVLLANCNSASNPYQIFDKTIKGNQNASLKKFSGLQSQITALGLETSYNFLLYSGYFCGMSAVTKISISWSLNETRSLGFNESCLSTVCCLCSLNHLSVTFNTLTVIRKSFLCGIPNLKILDMSFNTITKIEDGTFSTLTKVETLHLSFNKLKHLSNDLFHPLQFSLKYLDLSWNKLDASIFIALQNLSQLETLDLHHNNISFLKVDYIKGLSSLKSLMLDNNRITSLGDELKLLRSLEAISLTSNFISNISESSFSALLNLTTVNLGDNRLDSIPTLIFKSNSELRELDISHNKFRRIPILKYVSNLRIFKMTNNLLESITSKDSSSLCLAANLNELDFSSNNISSIVPGIFSCHSNLTLVNLRNNTLKSVSAMKSSTVAKLIVSDNQIMTFSFRDISPSLIHLDISENGVKELNFECLYSYPKTLLTFLDLSWNNINRISINDKHNSSCQNSLPYTIDLSFNAVQSLCNIIPNVKENVTFPTLRLHDNPIKCYCEENFFGHFPNFGWYHVDSSYCYPEIEPADLANNVENLRKLNLLDTFTCGYSPGDSPCECNVDPDYYHICGFSCPNGCKCFIGNTFDEHLVICSNLNLTSIPRTDQMFESGIIIFSGNLLTFLNDSMLSSYVNATTLFLSNNSLKMINDASFFYFHQLKALYLDNNLLTILSYDMVRNLKHLRVLDVSHNMLVQIQDDVFRELQSLQTLALHDNRLSSISVTNLNYLNSSSVRELSVRGNPWSCDCEFILPFRDWLVQNLKLVKDHDSLFCMQDNLTQIPLLHFNSSDCLDGSLGDVFLQNIPMWTSIISVMTFITIVAVLLYLYRKEMQVLFYSRYGIRLFQSIIATDQEKRYDVFLAYSSLDGEFVVERLLPGLEQIDRPYRVCVHQRDFLVGAIITDSILEAVEVSARTIVVLSEHFVKSGWCRFEFKSAHLQMLSDRCARLIVVVLGNIPTDLDPEMRLYLKTNTYLEWGDRLFWEKLYFALPDRKCLNTANADAIIS